MDIINCLRVAYYMFYLIFLTGHIYLYSCRYFQKKNNFSSLGQLQSEDKLFRVLLTALKFGTRMKSVVRSRAFLAGAGAEHFWLEPEPNISGWSRSRAFLAGAGAELHGSAPAPAFYNPVKSDVGNLLK